MKIQLKPDEIAALLRRQMQQVDQPIDIAEVGTVLSVGDGIARVDGLSKVMFNELVETEDGVAGLALNLEEESVGVAILDDVTHVREGDLLRRTGRVVSVPVGPALTGRVVDALGRPLDGRGAVITDEQLPVEGFAPSITERKNVCEPLQTGILAIDALTPIGRGQRELIIGDRKNRQDHAGDRHDPASSRYRRPLLLRGDRPEALDRRRVAQTADGKGRDGLYDDHSGQRLGSRTAAISGTLFRMRDGRVLA